MKNYIPSGATLTAMALALSLAPMQSAYAHPEDELVHLRQQMAEMIKRMEELENRQVEAEVEIEETRKTAVITSGKSPGSFVLPGSDTTITVYGYVKADLIYDVNEGNADVFIPEGITTSGKDESRFRAHARQTRFGIKTSTPTDMGPLKTHFEGDFFGSGGNQIFSNSTSFRLRHAFGSVGGLLAGQTWSNFMPIESYPSTIDFNGPAGLTFIRQAQVRYTAPIGDGLTISGSIENSEFNGRAADGTVFGEGRGGIGLNAGIDKAPDFTVALRYRDDWGLVKLAGLGRFLGSPNDQGDDDFGWGIGLSGNAKLWPGGKVVGSFLYGDGVGRYLINGFGQDAFVDEDGDVHTIEAFGGAVQVRQQLNDEFAVALAYGRSESNDSQRGSDLDNVNTVHASLFWSPVERLTFGGEVIWGNREDADGSDDSAVRLQTSVQVNF
ncbi:MAG: DcaP family trimeric outer membrane transporter [Alphaproteobacteria bacterium]